MQHTSDNEDAVFRIDDHDAEVDKPLVWIHRAQDEQLALCRQLEAIADSLPSSIDRVQCLDAARALGPLVRGIHHYEEAVLFPWLENRPSTIAGLRNTLDRLKSEHYEDDCFAEELTDALLKLGAGNPVNMEAVGYMLRGFFEVMRRHIAFERELLLRDIPDAMVNTAASRKSC